MSNIDSDEERDGFPLNLGDIPTNVKPGMFVSGWLVS
jgi:hypothetical protein